MPSSVFGARISSNISSIGGQMFVFDGFIFFNFFYILSTHSSLFKQSHIPSHAKIINLSDLLLFLTVTSGKAVTAYFSGLNYA
jgi:hypothetical protein